MSEQGVPVINLTNVNELTRRFASSIVTPERPEIGLGSLYYKKRVDVTATALLTALLASVVFIVIRLDVKHYIRRNPRAAEDAL